MSVLFGAIGIIAFIFLYSLMLVGAVKLLRLLENGAHTSFWYFWSKYKNDLTKLKESYTTPKRLRYKIMSLPILIMVLFIFAIIYGVWLSNPIISEPRGEITPMIIMGIVFSLPLLGFIVVLLVKHLIYMWEGVNIVVTHLATRYKSLPCVYRKT